MPVRSRPVSLCGHKLHGLQHVCAFFDSREEQYDVLNPYFQEGLEVGDEVVTIVESAVHADHVQRMKDAGVPVESAIEREQLKVLRSEDSYIQDQVFVVDRMFDMLREVLEKAEGGKYGAVRTFGDMEWALKNLPGTDELMVYEARVNEMAPHHDCTLLCAYDINRFSGRVVADVLATHSHVIIGGKLYENPYFSDPKEFLHKLALRRRSEPVGREAA